LDRTIKTSEDVERELDIPFLGSLPMTDDSAAARGEEAALMAHHQPSSVLAEAARGIRTNLLFMSPDKPYRRLLITSPGPGEGKTTVASTIAVALAQAGQRVILVDCDLRRPRLHKVFGRLNDAGVSSATLDLDSLDQMDLATVVPNLSVLPAGPHVPNPAEFLHSDALYALLDRLNERYDRVVIDTPPASVVSDASILSAKVQGVLMVFRSMKTPKDTARKTLRGLRDIDAPIVGGVLNALDAARLGYEKYHYYHYKYYGRDESSTDTDAAA
jgi:capsular exopolysaccharide synthesis family protein